MSIFCFFLDLFFPPQCVVCRSDSGSWVCDDCSDMLELACCWQIYDDILFPVLTVCKYSLSIRKVLYALKYNFFSDVVLLFHPLIHEAICHIDTLPYHEIVFVPVPLHWKRELTRGFNQSKKLIPSCYEILSMQKTRATQSQVSLSRIQRQNNVKGVFFCPVLLDPNTLYIMVDDVVTTGSTFSALYDSLVCAGANHVIALSIVRYKKSP